MVQNIFNSLNPFNKKSLKQYHIVKILSIAICYKRINNNGLYVVTHVLWAIQQLIIFAQGKRRHLRLKIAAWVKSCDDDIVLERLEEFLDTGAVYEWGNHGKGRTFGRGERGQGRRASRVFMDAPRADSMCVRHGSY